MDINKNEKIIETVLKSNNINMYNIKDFTIDDLIFLAKKAKENNIKLSLKSNDINVYIQFFKNTVDKEFLLEVI